VCASVCASQVSLAAPAPRARRTEALLPPPVEIPCSDGRRSRELEASPRVVINVKLHRAEEGASRGAAAVISGAN
jgi:hypothetical protein